MQQNQPVPGRPLSRLASLLQRGPPAPPPPPAPAPPPAQPTQSPPFRAPIRLPSFPRPLAPPTTAPPPPPPPPPAPAPEVEALPPLRPIQTRPPVPSPTQVTPPQTPPVPSPKPAQTQVTNTQRQTSPRTAPSPPSPKPEISQAAAATTTTRPQVSPKSAPNDYAQPWTLTMPPAPTSTSVPPSPKPTVQPPASPRPRAVQYRSLTPPQSPKIIKPSEPTPPPSPKTIQQQPTLSPRPPTSISQPKGIFSQYKNGNGNSNVTSDKKEEPPVEKNHTHLSPKKGDGVTDGKIASNSTMPSGKKKAEKSKEEEQTGWRLITIAGENMGAYMELGSGYQKLQKQQTTASLFKYQHNSKISEVQEIEPRSDMKESMTASKARPLAALVNSNVQAINNSMVFNSSCSHKSPGVHLNVSSHRLPTGTSSSHPKKGE